LTNRLIDDIFGSIFANPILDERHDGALMSTDSYVVRPLFFPCGDIGSLAVNGTVNDLAMCGAKPMWITCAMILEEGVPVETVRKVAESMKRAADLAGVQIVTGDTKVVDKGKGDGIYINTAGVGLVEARSAISPKSVKLGDMIIVSGDVGRHGIAIMAVREGLEFETVIETDCAPLWEPVSALIESDIEIHCLRDLTRGGLASALCEISETAGVGIEVDEKHIPVREDVHGACELLGLNPYYVANEGRFIVIVPADHAKKALEVMRSVDVSSESTIIGNVVETHAGSVTIRSLIGVDRILDMLSGEQLPRIC
jgi:hydrogenase expression/formation protein HypE